MTAGIQPAVMTGSQLPCLIACTATLTATKTAARAAIARSHRVHEFMLASPCQASLS